MKKMPMKSIQTPSQESYKLLIDKIESIIKRMSWKAYFFMKNKVNNDEEPRKETYEFKSRYHSSQSKYLEAFEKDLFSITSTFKSIHNDSDQYIMIFNKK